MTQFPRRLARAALVASTALALGAPAMAAPGKGGHGTCHPGMSRLTVTGQGEARVAPDLATIQLGVTTQAAGAADAMRQNSQQQTAVFEALAGAGIDAADVQTSGLNLNPVMDYGEGRAPTVTGYQASNMVSVRVKDVARLGEVLDAIVAAGANEINGISFIRDDSSATEDEARRAAVEDARHKAEVLAEAAGLTLGPVLVLRDTPTPEGPRPMMMEARAAADSAKVPIAAGEVALSALVEMQFALGGQDCGPMGGKGGRGHHNHGLPEGHPPMPGDDTGAPVPGDDADAPVPGDDAGVPVPGDVPPPLGTDTGAPEPGQPVVPMGTPPAEGQTPAN
ncbi:26 kDa periplasmic immunogenic protein precursor [Paracoccus haematequi]|uniref:26 kDa periplasmic immunogenic protein n=1 Tax=Paracoccus haematequi TaxID=2491866 RepID=A0A447IRZ0_9RHOB|nr:SIMPL domain-containing protein [Paracoccus haematequi]VDS10244.1 26 kDa periplasmic immunogenic protein precursor [Paracoccus haematequi]